YARRHFLSVASSSLVSSTNPSSGHKLLPIPSVRAMRKVCARFVELCREMGLRAKASVAIDRSKFKAVNNRDRNFTHAKVERRRAQLEPTGPSSRAWPKKARVTLET